MVNIKGSHGTTCVRANKIKSEGFITSGGRYVKGVYFWKECYHDYNLAVGWYNHCFASGLYSDEDSPQCAVIYVKLCCKDDEILDLERADLKDRLAKLADSRHINQNNNREIKSLYTYVIREMERIIGIKYKLFLLNVEPPKVEYCPKYKSRLLGYPTCVIAVSNENISIENIQRG